MAYIDANGNPTAAFNSLASADELILSADLSGYSKVDIFNLIKSTNATGKVAPNNFNNITKEVANTKTITTQEVFNQLQDSGYIDESGNVYNSLPGNFAIKIFLIN